MRTPLRQWAASVAVAALVLAPVSAGVLVLTADDAVAKADKKSKAKAGGGKSAKARKDKKREKAKAGKTKKNKPEKAARAERDAKRPKAEKVPAALQTTEDGPVTDHDGHDQTDDQIVYGNPGNDKEVGRAGENPNGKDGWGGGSRGRSDADSDDGQTDDDDDYVDGDDILDDADPDAADDDSIDLTGLLPEAGSLTDAQPRRPRDTK